MGSVRRVRQGEIGQTGLRNEEMAWDNIKSSCREREEGWPFLGLPEGRFKVKFRARTRYIV